MLMGCSGHLESCWLQQLIFGNHPGICEIFSKQTSDYMITRCLEGGVHLLTLCFLALAWRFPADAGAMLIQVEESHQSLGSRLQLDHLCPGLHHAHASLHCESQHMQKNSFTLSTIISDTKRSRCPALFVFSQEEGRLSVTESQSVKQPAADVSQSPSCNRDATVGTHKAASLLPTDLLLRETLRREEWKRLKGRYSSNVCASVLGFSEGLKAVQKYTKINHAGSWLQVLKVPRIPLFCFR